MFSCYLLALVLVPIEGFCHLDPLTSGLFWVLQHILNQMNSCCLNWKSTVKDVSFWFWQSMVFSKKAEHWCYDPCWDFWWRLQWKFMVTHELFCFDWCIPFFNDTIISCSGDFNEGLQWLLFCFFFFDIAYFVADLFCKFNCIYFWLGS